MANHRHDDGANAELLWDTDFGECGQPYLHLKRFVEPGEEITVELTSERHSPASPLRIRFYSERDVLVTVSGDDHMISRTSVPVTFRVTCECG